MLTAIGLFAHGSDSHVPAPCLWEREAEEKLTGEALQDSITLEDEPSKRPSGDENRRMNNPPPAPRNSGQPGPSHKPTRSQEEARRARKMEGGGSRRPDGPSQSPHKRPERRPRPRPRRNSDSSLLIDIEKPLTEEEKKARDARRRERERRHRPTRPSRKVDLIDQLDMTGVYGPGGKLLARHFPLGSDPDPFSPAGVSTVFSNGRPYLHLFAEGIPLIS